jgi:curved DNA-binding protein CbpA
MHDFEELDHYEILDVPRNASSEEIKRAYRQQVSRYHPDRYAQKSPPEQAYASLRTQRINEAYRVLSDFKARTAYNRGQSLPSSMRSASSAGIPRPVAPDAPQRTGGPRDHQAELYEQARMHLAARRMMQAAATLRELQQINPFYRDSAALLAQAEANLHEQQAQTGYHTAAQSASKSTPPRRRRAMFLIGGGSVLAATGIAVALWGFGQFQTTGAAVAPTATITTTATPADVVALSTSNDDTDQPAADTETPAAAASPAPTDIPASPAPTDVPASPAPTDVPASPTPTDVPASPTPRVQPERGELVFNDTFSTPGTWAIQQGFGWSVGYPDEYYRIVTEPGPGDIWSYRTAYEAPQNFSLGVDMQVLSGEAGLMMRYVDRTNYVAFFLRPANGTYSLEHVTPTGRNVLAEGESPAILRGPEAINRIAARLQGNQIQAFVNNRQLADVTVDNTRPTTVYGLIARGSTQTAEALFDNVEIRTLE